MKRYLGRQKIFIRRSGMSSKYLLAYLSHTMATDAGATSQQLNRAFGWKSVSTAEKYVDEPESGAQAIASVFNFTKAPTTNNTTEVSQQDGERVTKIYNIHGSGENCNLNFY